MWGWYNIKLCAWGCFVWFDDVCVVKFGAGFAARRCCFWFVSVFGVDFLCLVCVYGGIRAGLLV